MAAQAKTAAKTAGHVVFAAALPDLEVAGGVNAALTGIEAEHNFAEAQAVPAAGRVENEKFFHILFRGFQ
jgi:hypothetical protein